MKTIGLIGGISWQSTCTYYDLLNEIVTTCIGGLPLLIADVAARYEMALFGLAAMWLAG